MRKNFFILFFLFFACFLQVQVGCVSVTDTDKHSKKEDFYHTFEYHVSSEKIEEGKCQATRIGRQWFVTAAHCVYRQCHDQECKLSLDLLEGPVSASVEVTHSDKEKHVFIHPDYNLKKYCKHDFALLKIDPAQGNKKFYRRLSKYKSNPLTKQSFEEFLAQTPTARRGYEKVISPAFPPLLAFENSTQKIDRHLSVISVFDGKRQVRQNPNPSYFLEGKGLLYTYNFGIVNGMSGSGLMSNTGEITGVVSCYYHSKKKGEDSFLIFTAFDGGVLEFMQKVMGNDYKKLKIKWSYPDFVLPSDRDHQRILHLLK